jgi:NAD kinase
MLTDRKIVVVTRKTRLQKLKEKYCTLGQAKFYLEHLGESLSDYEEESMQYSNSVTKAISFLKAVGRVQQLERSVLSTYLFSPDDVVVVIGQDGLVANTLKYLDGQPVIAVNPIPSLYDGQLLPFLGDELEEVLLQTLSHSINSKSIAMAEVNTNIGQTLLAVNDLFIGPKTHTSSRYLLSVDNYQEEQSSSGVIVSTGLGSTGWFRSIITGASGIIEKPINYQIKNGFPWDSEFLYYSVREPFPSAITKCDKIFGKITNRSKFSMSSKMAENGVIFSDGIEQDCIEFNAGTIANISISSRVGNLIVGH